MITMDKSIRTVDEYLADLPPEIKKALSKLRSVIRSAAPNAEEVISYGIPAYKQNGPVVFFAAQKSHLSLYVVNKKILDDYRGELKTFETSGTTIHFYPDTPIPPAVVKNIVKQRIVENALRVSGTAKKKATASHRKNDLPEKLGRPAENALAAAGILSLKHLTKLTEKQVADLHGVGPNAVGKLRSALKASGISFRREIKK